MTKLYSELAEWWPLMSAPANYAEEAVDHSELEPGTYELFVCVKPG